MALVKVSLRWSKRKTDLYSYSSNHPTWIRIKSITLKSVLEPNVFTTSKMYRKFVQSNWYLENLIQQLYSCAVIEKKTIYKPEQVSRYSIKLSRKKKIANGNLSPDDHRITTSIIRTELQRDSNCEEMLKKLKLTILEEIIKRGHVITLYMNCISQGQWS